MMMSPLATSIFVALSGDSGGTTGGGDVYGCTDSSACNHDVDGTIDDGSCEELD